MAIEALGIIGKKEGSIFVEQALNDPDIWVRIKAKVSKKQIAANQLQGQAKINYLMTVLGEDDQYEVQKWAARELFEMGESGVNILKQIAKEKGNKGAYPAYKELKGRGIVLE
ncbi:MAG: HEAT repeat domain-containing protein [Elusimicrobiota bacterium]